MNCHRLLLIENLPSLARVYQAVLAGAGYAMVSARNQAEALQHSRDPEISVALIDLRQTGMSGIELMRDCLRQRPDLRVILVAANGSVPRVVEAMRAGAWDYIVTPVDEKRLLSAIARAVPDAFRTGAKRNGASLPEGFIAASPAGKSIAERLPLLARSKAPVVICGESGTGKTLCARILHRLSDRASAPLTILRSANAAPELLDQCFASVLPEGASLPGTLVIEDVCLLPPAFQDRLMEVFDSDADQPGDGPRPPRVIATCPHADPETLEADGLREDLYHRLRGLMLVLPPLRERVAAIEPLSKHYLRRFAGEFGREFHSFSPDALDLLQGHGWPGNIRELINTLRQSVLLNEGEVMEATMLRDCLEIAALPPTSRIAPFAETAPSAGGLVGLPLSEVERLVIEATIIREEGSLPRAAAILGVSPSTLYRKRDSWAST